MSVPPRTQLETAFRVVDLEEQAAELEARLKALETVLEEIEGRPLSPPDPDTLPPFLKRSQSKQKGA